MDYRIKNIDIILFALSSLILQAEDLILEGDKNPLLEEIIKIAQEEQQNLLNQVDPEGDVIEKPNWK